MPFASPPLGGSCSSISSPEAQEAARLAPGTDDEDVLVDASRTSRANREDDDNEDDVEGYSDGEAETHAEHRATDSAPNAS